MASMSNLREELSKLAATFKTTGNTTRHRDSFENIHTALPLLDPRGQATQTMRNVAAVEVLADAFTLAATAISADFDLYEGIVRAAKDRRVTILPDVPTVVANLDGRKVAEQIAKHTGEIGVRAKTPQIDVMIFGSPEMLSGLPLNYAEAGMAALLLDLCYPETLLEAEVRESLRQIQRRDDVIEKTWQAIKDHAHIHDVSWVPCGDGSSKRAEVRKPADKLPEVVSGVVKALESAQKNRASAVEHSTKLEADLKATLSTISKCMQALETCEVGKPGEELETCRKIAANAQELRRQIEALRKAKSDDANRHYQEKRELIGEKRIADEKLTGEKTKFAEYRRNVELRDNVAADCRKRLEIAALSDRLIVSVDFMRGSVYIDGWRVATEGMAKHFERCLGLRMDHDTVEMHVNGIRDELRKLDSRLFAGVEYERDPASARTIGATIKINAEVRDELAFRGMATSLERHKRESPDAVRSV